RQPDQPALGVDERTAGIAADDVVGGDIIEWRGRIEPLTGIQPNLRQPERILTGGTLIDARELRERLDVLAFFLPALYGAVADAQGERGVGIGIGSEQCETGLGNA